MSMIYSGDYIQFPDAVQMPTYPQGWRNRIGNGDMRIAQRSGAANVSYSTASISTYAVDRFFFYTDGAGSGSVFRSTTVPPGFTNSFGLSVTSGVAPSAGMQQFISTVIEGYNIADLGWGTANAQPVTLSFWVRASLAGAYGLAAFNAAGDSMYCTAYTVNAINTWEYKTITIPGPTTNTWLTDNSKGIVLRWGLGSGSNFNQGTINTWSPTYRIQPVGGPQIVANTGATFYLTGVQLEKGTTATPFEYIDYSEQLRRCQRYYWKSQPVSGGRFGVGQCFGAGSSTGGNVFIQLPVTMRVPPAGEDIYATASEFRVLNSAGSGIGCNSLPVVTVATTTNIAEVSVTVASGLTAGDALILFSSSGLAHIGFAAEF